MQILQVPFLGALAAAVAAEAPSLSAAATNSATCLNQSGVSSAAIRSETTSVPQEITSYAPFETPIQASTTIQAFLDSPSTNVIVVGTKTAAVPDSTASTVIVPAYGSGSTASQPKPDVFLPLTSFLLSSLILKNHLAPVALTGLAILGFAKAVGADTGAQDAGLLGDLVPSGNPSGNVSKPFSNSTGEKGDGGDGDGDGDGDGTPSSRGGGGGGSSGKMEMLPSLGFLSTVVLVTSTAVFFDTCLPLFALSAFSQAVQALPSSVKETDQTLIFEVGGTVHAGRDTPGIFGCDSSFLCGLSSQKFLAEPLSISYAAGIVLLAAAFSSRFGVGLHATLLGLSLGAIASSAHYGPTESEVVATETGQITAYPMLMATPTASLHVRRENSHGKDNDKHHTTHHFRRHWDWIATPVAVYPVESDPIHSSEHLSVISCCSPGTVTAPPERTASGDFVIKSPGS